MLTSNLSNVGAQMKFFNRNSLYIFTKRSIVFFNSCISIIVDSMIFSTATINMDKILCSAALACLFSGHIMATIKTPAEKSEDIKSLNKSHRWLAEIQPTSIFSINNKQQVNFRPDDVYPYACIYPNGVLQDLKTYFEQIGIDANRSASELILSAEDSQKFIQLIK